MRGVGQIKQRKFYWKKKLNNPIIWNKMKWRWMHRGPKANCSMLCVMQVEEGELAWRRLRQPGWLLEKMVFREMGLTKWPGEGKMLVPEKS